MFAAPKDRCPLCGQGMPLLPIKEAAKLANVNRKTIYRWIRSGILDYRTVPSGAIRVVPESLLRLPRKAHGARRSGPSLSAPAETAIGGAEIKVARGRED